MRVHVRTHAQGSKLAMNDVDAEEPDVSDLKLLPDTASLADKLKGCLQVRCALVFAPATARTCGCCPCISHRAMP